ncbi:MAG TPA: site-specific integrase [Mycobacteriales bacterium]
MCGDLSLGRVPPDAAGLRGDKGVPDTVTAHPAVFPTLTPPSLAIVHSRQAIARDLLDLIRWMLATGLRIGEALAVAWSDVDLDTATVEVDWKLIRIRARACAGAPAESRRRPQPAAAAFAVTMLRRRRPHPGALGPVFPDAVGGRRDPSNTSRAFREARDAAGFS